MSSVTIQGNPSGTGIFTVASPNSNTNQTLVLPNASGTLLTNSGTEAGAFSTLSVAGNNISAVNSLGFRNRIINGDMRIDQRNAGASVTPTDGLYSLDRWRFQVSQTSRLTVQRNAGSVTPPAGFTNYLGVTSTAATSLSAGDYFGVFQQIEGFNIADLAWGTASAQPVTLSFWVRSSLTGTFGGALKNGLNNRSYPFTYSISAANTWELKTLTIAGPTTGTWYPDAGPGIQVNFNLGTGSTFSGTAGSWANSDFVAPTGAVSVVSTNGATFYITGVQLEAGPVATPFERRDIGRELMMCQRYYEKSFPQNTAPSNGASATTFSVNEGSVTGVAQNRLSVGPTVFFRVTKRAAPLVTKFGNNSGDWIYGLQGSTAWVGGASNDINRISENSFSTNQNVIDATLILISGHWTASAEL